MEPGDLCQRGKEGTPTATQPLIDWLGRQQRPRKERHGIVRGKRRNLEVCVLGSKRSQRPGIMMAFWLASCTCRWRGRGAQKTSAGA